TSFSCPAWCADDEIHEDTPGGAIASCIHTVEWEGVATHSVTVTVEQMDEPGRALRKPTFSIDTDATGLGSHDLEGLTHADVLVLIDALLQAASSAAGTSVDSVLGEVQALA
ncbi:MAG TPA: hypothetical protein VHO91_02210, partial [Rhodopila sp.]|nr:hypothetical protein [Rhodopila sp.]